MNNSRIRALALFVAAGSGAHAVRAQEPQVEPDQRDFTNGTSVVERFQVESSSFSTQRGPIREYRIAESLLRIPVAKGAEIRVTAPGYTIDRGIGFNGLEDANLEARIQLGSARKTRFALTFGSTLPTGKRFVAERRYQPQAIVAANFALGPKTELLANIGVGRPTEQGERFTQSIFALSLRHDVSPRLNVFGEVFGFNRLAESQGSQKFGAVGAVFYLNRKTALFGRAGKGFGNEFDPGLDGPDRFLQVGLARLF